MASSKALHLHLGSAAARSKDGEDTKRGPQDEPSSSYSTKVTAENIDNQRHVDRIDKDSDENKEEEEDQYAALDELRVLTKYSIDDLKMFHRWYCNYVNPRKSPALHGANLAQFAATFRNASPKNPTVLALFKRFLRPNGVADMLEVFAGMCVICDGSTKDKIDFLFGLFDFANKGDMVEDEATLMLECIAGAFTTIGLIVMPDERDLEFASGWIYTDRHTGETRSAASVEDFQRWVNQSPSAGEILSMLDIVPIVEEILRRFHRVVAELVSEILTEEDREEYRQSMRKNKAAPDSFLGGSGGFRRLEDITYRDDVRVLVGPIIGKVSYDSVVVLLEVDTETTVGICIVLAGGYTGNSIALLPESPASLGAGPSRAGQLRERLVRVQTLKLKACRPRSVLITGLKPGSQYRVVLSGVSPDDSATRVGSFRTLRVVDDSDSRDNCGTGVLLQHRYFFNRYHMQHVEDKATFGGVATGPLEDGLTVAAVSGDAKTIMGSLMRKKESVGEYTFQHDTDAAIEQEARLHKKFGANPDQGMSPSINEPSLWKTLWETSVRPSRLDMMLHLGSQVSVSEAATSAITMLRRFDLISEGGETKMESNSGENAGAIGRKSSFLKIRKAVIGENLLSGVAGLRKAQLDAKRLEAKIEAENMKADEDVKEAGPQQQSATTSTQDQKDDNARDISKSTMGSIDFAALADDLASIVSSEGSDEEVRRVISKLQGPQAKRARTALKAHAMETIRDVYRRSWNLVYTRECLAHVPNLASWGFHEIFLGNEVNECSSHAKLLRQMCRRAYWEYQRQLWDVDCVWKMDRRYRRSELERRRQALEKLKELKSAKNLGKHIDSASDVAKSSHSKHKSDPWTRVLNGEMEYSDTIDGTNGSMLADKTSDSINRHHEGHFHRYGNVGILFVDAIGNRLCSDGSINPKAPPISEGQFKDISNSLGLDGPDGVQGIRCLLVALQSPFTGRSRLPENDENDGSAGASEEHHVGKLKGKETNVTELSYDIWSYPNAELCFCRLADLLFRWMHGFGGSVANSNFNREVQILSAAGGVGAAGVSFLKDRLSELSKLKHITVGPLSDRTIGHAPSGDPRSIQYQASVIDRQRKMGLYIPVGSGPSDLPGGISKQAAGEPNYPLSLKSRRVASNEDLWVPEITYQAGQLWNRRNYALLRVFSGNRSSNPGVKKAHGASDLSASHLSPTVCRVETELVPAFACDEPSMILGPVIGRVTQTSAVVMIEIDRDAVVTCRLRDVLNGKERVAILSSYRTTTKLCSGVGEADGLTGKVVRGGRPSVFLAEDLAPGRRYALFFDGISNGQERRGSLVTKSVNMQPLTPESSVNSISQASSTFQHSLARNLTSAIDLAPSRFSHDNFVDNGPGDNGTMVRLIACSTDHPHLLSTSGSGEAPHDAGAASHHRDAHRPPNSSWESIWRDQVLSQWSACDYMIRLGGQVWLRGELETSLSSILESRKVEVFAKVTEALFQVRQNAIPPLPGDAVNIDEMPKLPRRELPEEAAMRAGDDLEDIVALKRGPLWTVKNLNVGALPAVAPDSADPIFTTARLLNDSVDDGTAGNPNDPDSGLRCGEAWAAYDELCNEIAEAFRNVYRRAWNVPWLKDVLANTPQMMISGGADLACGFDSWLNRTEQRVFGPVILGVCREVQREYQDQLWDPHCLGKDADKAVLQSHRGRSVRLGSAQNVLLVTLDLWSSRIATAASDVGDGSRAKAGRGGNDESVPLKDRHIPALYWEPDRPLIGDDQWKFLESLLEDLDEEEEEIIKQRTSVQENTDNRERPTTSSSSSASATTGLDADGLPVATPTPIGAVDTLFICSDVPFTGRTPAEVHQMERSKPPSWARDDWSCREDEFVRLLQLLFKWKVGKRDTRQVYLLSGDGCLGPAGECYFTDVESGMRIRQLVVGPTSGLPTGALPEKEVHFGEGGCFTRTPIYRTFFRNYGVISVTPPEANQSRGSTPSEITRPGSRSSTNRRPSTRGSTHTSRSSAAAMAPFRSRTRVSLVTQTNFSRGDASPLPPLERTPQWWTQRTGMFLYQGVAKPTNEKGQAAMTNKKKMRQPTTLEDRKVKLENDMRQIQNGLMESKNENDKKLQVLEVKDDDNHMGEMHDKLSEELAEGKRSLKSYDVNASDEIQMSVNLIQDSAAQRRAFVLDKGSSVIRWARAHLRLAMEDRDGQSGGITATAIEYVYRRFYLQVDRLADSCFYEEIADRIHLLPQVLGNRVYAGDSEDSYDKILMDMGKKVDELRGFEPGILEERAQVQFKHDTLVGKYQRTYEARLRVERKKREIFYHVQGRLTDCLTAIVSATARAGYPTHKGGQKAMRGENSERKIEVVRRADRRERQALKFQDKTNEMHEMKSHADLVVSMDVDQIKEEKRLSPVHVDDADQSKIATAVVALCTFVQTAGIPKKKIKKFGNVLAKEATRLLKDQNVVRLQRQKVMLVNITDEVPDCLAAVQQMLLDKIQALKDAENEKVRDHRAKMSWLQDRIELLSSIDEQVTELEAECVTLREELEQRQQELREATELRMEAQLELKAKKNDRRIALAVYDKQLETLDEQVRLGDTRAFIGRVEKAVQYLWCQESTGQAIPRPLKSALPDLGDNFVLAHCIDAAFPRSSGVVDTNGNHSEDARGNSRPPQSPEAFYRCITEVILQAASVRVAMMLPLKYK